MIVDADLNGDGVPEKIVVFYFWPKYGGDPDSAARYFRSHSVDGWDVNALLILARNGKSWRASSYNFWDEGGRMIHVGRSPGTGLNYLCADTDGPCLAWGAATRGGGVGPLVGFQTRYARSVLLPRFDIRTGYPN